MAERSPELTQFYADVIIGATEGGTNYWAFSRNYKWSDEDPSTTTVEYCDMEFYGTPDEEWHTVTVDTIAKAFGIIMGPKEEIKHLHSTSRARYSRAQRAYDFGELDAGDADNIVQVGIFGEVVYG